MPGGEHALLERARALHPWQRHEDDGEHQEAEEAVEDLGGVAEARARVEARPEAAAEVLRVGHLHVRIQAEAQ